MARLPPIKRFVQEDFSGINTITAFTGKLFYPLNLFLNAVYSALANGLTLSANTIGQVGSPTTVTSSSLGVATTTMNWPYPQSPPTGLVVMSCTSSSLAVTYPLISWSYNAGVISISLQFTTITAGAVVADTAKTYSVVFWASGG